MKTLTYIVAVSVLMLTQVSYADGLYKWIDAKGNAQYGDRPPANSNAKPITLPKITIIDNYANQWKPLNFDETAVVKKPVQVKSSTTPAATSPYTKLAFLAPKANQAIRANDGDVSAMISIKPPLKKGHKIEFAINGKSLGKGTSRTKNFENLNRGKHAITAKIVDSNGQILKSSSVGFNVLRANLLNQNQSNQAAKAPQARTFNSVRQSQIQINTQERQIQR